MNDAPAWLANAIEAMTRPMTSRAWAIPPARVVGVAPQDQPTVDLLRKVAQNDMRLAIWMVIHASPLLDPTTEEVARATAWCLETTPLEEPSFRDVFHALDLAAVVPRHRLRYDALLRQARPMRVASGTLTRRLSASPALAVAWDATVDAHLPRDEDPVTHLRQVLRERIGVLTRWLQDHDSTRPWTPSAVWCDPVARMLCERSDLRRLPR